MVIIDLCLGLCECYKELMVSTSTAFPTPGEAKLIRIQVPHQVAIA